MSDLRSTFDLFTDLNSHVNRVTSKVDEVTALQGLGITSIQKHVRPCINALVQPLYYYFDTTVVLNKRLGSTREIEANALASTLRFS